MSWEAWDLLWSSGLLLFFLQALVMRFNSTCSYSVVDVAMSSRTLFPFMGDGFDVVKDAMLASMVMQSELHWISYLGQESDANKDGTRGFGCRAGSRGT